MKQCNQFREIVYKEKKAHPEWFELAEEYVPSDVEIFNLEKKLGVALPEKFRCLLSHFHVGYFAFVILYSAWKESEFYMYDMNIENKHMANCFVLFSENQSGDFYGFKVEENIATDNIWFYDHEMDEWLKTKYKNVFEYVYDRGIKLYEKVRPD